MPLWRIIFEILWLAVCCTAAGVIFVMLQDAKKSEEAVEQATLRGLVEGDEAQAQRIVARKAVRLERVRLAEQVTFIVLAVVSGLYPPPPGDPELVAVRVLIGLAAQGLAVLLCLNAIWDKADRAHLRAIIRRKLAHEKGLKEIQENTRKLQESQGQTG